MGKAGTPGPLDEARTPTRERVRRLLASGLTVGEAARALEITAAAVSYHRRKLGLRPSGKYAPRNDWEEIQRYYDEGHGVHDCELRFGFSRRSWNKAVLRGAVVPRPQAMPIEQLLTVGRARHRGHVKRRLLAAGLKKERCEECGIAEWLGQPLSMALHHVNGNGVDNRLENLAFLCPNCHSQTPNFGRRDGHLPTRSAA